MMLRSLCALLALLLLPTAALADDNRPLTISIEETGSDTFVVTWKMPANVEQRHLPALRAPDECTVGEHVRQWSDPLGHWREERWRCANGLRGQSIAIDYPYANPNLATIARLRLADSEETVLLLQPQETRLAIPADAQVPGTFRDFYRLGIEHIWLGIDHLLFVAGLIFVAGTLRRVLATITGFTIAHSITLALSALDVVRLPVAAVEAVIALSIVFLAVEIAKGPRDTITWRRPVTVAASFGLLHGFGFAAVLRQIGLPEDGLLTALLAFNLGIETGQIIFAAALMSAFSALRLAGKSALFRRSFRRTGRLQNVFSYVLGIVASYWMFTRFLI
jgi:hydrogenase/urease accessory protein HupE